MVLASDSFLVSPDVGLMIWTLVVFAISLYVLSKVAFPRIAEALDKRRRAIEESIDSAERTRVEADRLLVAVGRGQNTAGQGFEEAGVNMERGFVLADERLRTNLDNVYALGDIVPGLQLAHRGFAQGIFVAEELGGQGLGVLELVILTEELGYVAAPSPFDEPRTPAAPAPPMSAPSSMPEMTAASMSSSLGRVCSSRS